jgi:hypothetical protein
MPYAIQLPDGTLVENIPDNLDPIEAKARISAHFKLSEPVKKNTSGFGDVATAAKQGLVGTAKSLTDVFGAENEYSEKLGGVQQRLEQEYTPARALERQKREQLQEEAAKSGDLTNEITTFLGGVTEAPVQAFASGLASIVPYVGTGFIGGIFKLGAPTVRALNSALGAAQGAGSIKGSVYGSVKKELEKEGMDPEEAKDRAIKAQEYLGDNWKNIVAGAGIGAIAGRKGVEELLVPGALARQQANIIPRVATTVLKEAPIEGLQGGQQQFAENIALQQEGFDVPTFQGVAGSAARDAAVGAITAAPLGAIAKPSKVDLEATYTNVIDELRNKLGTSETLEPQEVLKQIQQISQLQDPAQIQALYENALNNGDFNTVPMPDNSIRIQIPEASTQQKVEEAIEDSTPDAFTPELRQSIESFKQPIIKQMQRFGLSNVGLKIFDTIENGRADGYYANKVIALAMDSPSPIGTLRHETVHALRELGGFKPNEWNVLSKKAKNEWTDQFIKNVKVGDGTLYDQYQAQYQKDNNGSLDGFDDYITEEAVAEAFRYFDVNGAPSGLVGNLYYRLKQFFETLRNGFTGAGFDTTDKIFTRVEQGKAAPTLEEVAEQPNKYAFKQTPAPEDVPQDIWNLYSKYDRITKMANEKIPSEPNAKGVYPRPQDLKKEETLSFRRLNKAISNYFGAEWDGNPSGPIYDMYVRLNEEMSNRDLEQEQIEEVKPRKYALTGEEDGTKRFVRKIDERQVGTNATEAGRIQGRGELLGGTRFLPASGRVLAETESLNNTPQEMVDVEIPSMGVVKFGPNPIARQVAETYMANKPYRPATNYGTINVERAKQIAKAYDEMKHEPNNPQVQASYKALAEETLAQWQAIKDTGLQVEFISEDMEDPYKLSPRLAIIDANQNNHLWVFPTDFGYGDTGALDDPTNPMLDYTDEIISGKKARVNDIFRIVHDYFGHIKDGMGFRAGGEENAWRSHVEMYSPLARPAMTVETRGQNSWVNFGPYAEFNKTANGFDTKYAPQKLGLLPDEFIHDGRPAETDYNPSIAIINGDLVPNLKGKPTVDLIGAYFDRLNEKPLDFKNKDTFNKMVQFASEEIKDQLKQENSGLDWYEQDIKKAFTDTIKVIPELDSVKNRQLFNVIAGIMSPSTTARDNWVIAAEAFQHYIKTGVIPPINPKNKQLWMGGLTSANKKKQLNLLNNLVKELGSDKAVEWMYSQHPISEINKTRKEYGGLGSIGGKINDSALGLFAFGPKVGPFVSNLNGIPDVTVDKWMTRTFNRYIGRMVDKSKKIIDKPTEQERIVIKNLINEVAKNEGIKPYQAQSILWFYEQRLFRALGTPSPSYGFSDGASKFLQQNSQGRDRSSEQGGRDGTKDDEGRTKFSFRSETNVQSPELTVRPSRGSGEGVVLGTKQEHALSYDGIHYSNSARKFLNGSSYGTGIRGKESLRLGYSNDPRIKNRSYFYIPHTDLNGQYLPPEAGLGVFKHQQKFDNILGPGIEMRRIYEESNADEDFNNFESAVIDNGYDGYASPNMGMMVILNHDNIPVDFVENTRTKQQPSTKYSLRTGEFKLSDLPKGDAKETKVFVLKQGTEIYHGSYKERAEKIKESGKSLTVRPEIIASGGDEREAGLIYFGDKETATDFSKNKADPFAVQRARDRGILREEGEVFSSIADKDYKFISTDYVLNQKQANTLNTVLGLPDYKKLQKGDTLSQAGLRATVYNDSKIDRYEINGIPRNNSYALSVKALGFDGIYEENLGVAITADNGIRLGTEDVPMQRYAIRAPNTPEFKRFFGSSKIVNEDGTPKVMYHGTARDISEFRPKQAGAIFLSFSPNFADTYTSLSEDYMAKEYLKSLPKEEEIKLYNQAKKIVKKEGTNLEDELHSLLKDKLQSRGNILPVFVKAENPFDYENPAHIEKILQSESGQDLYAEELPYIRVGAWDLLEKPHVQRAIKEAGFDSFYIKEGGYKNLGVYNPAQVKSATGNIGTFDIGTPDIRYSLNRLTTLQTNKTAGQKISQAYDTAKSNFGNSDYWIAKRNGWIDPSSGLAKSLQKLPVFNLDGELRADMLVRAKSQALNLIKNGLLSGIPVLNADGTIGIQRSENNFARSMYLADQLNNNATVKASGLSGRGYVAEVARILRGADILKEDARLNAEGVRQLAEAKIATKEAKDLFKQGKMKEARKKQKEAKKLREEGTANAKSNRELQVTPAHIKWAEQQLAKVPEMNEILGIWKTVNNGLVDLWESVGLLSESKADEYRGKENYIPLFKSQEDLGDAEFFAFPGGGLKSTKGFKRLKGSTAIRNIWENLDKHYAVMLSHAYENQTRRVAVSQLKSLQLAESTNANDPESNLWYKEDGKKVGARVENLNDLAAFQMMTYELGPIMQFFAGSTQLLRAGALINPMYWIKQLIRDPIHANLVAGSGMITPLHSMRGFVEVLMKNSRESKILTDRGVLGSVDSTTTINQFLEQFGKEKASPSILSKALSKVMSVHEASDAATRVEIYKKAEAKALKEGKTAEQAMSYAVHMARESINFSVHGNSPTLNALRHSIPFFSAAINSLDTVYRAATGFGLNAKEKKEAQLMFFNRAVMMTILSTMYAMLYQDDEEYKKLPDYVKDNNWLIPNPMSEKPPFIKVPTPFEIGFFFKTIPEGLVRYFSDTSTGKEVLASYKAGLIHNLPANGLPIPQAIKPVLENIVNYSFFTGRGIEGMSDQGRPVAERGQRASEFAKTLSSYGLDRIGQSPAKIDNLIQGYFAELGTFSAGLASSLLFMAEGKEPPAKNIENMPFMKAFLTDRNVVKAISDFYELDHNAKEVATQFNDLKQSGMTGDIQRLIDDPEKKAQLMASPVFRKVSTQMATIRKAITYYKDNQDSGSPEFRRDKINELTEILGRVAESGYKIAEATGVSR